MKIEMFNVIAVCASAPLCLMIIFAGLNWLKRTPGRGQTVKGTLPGGASFELGEASNSRRDTDRPDGIRKLAEELAPLLSEVMVRHTCIQMDLIGGISRGTVALATAQEVTMRSEIQAGKNGDFKRAYEEVQAFRKEFSDLLSDKALGVRP